MAKLDLLERLCRCKPDKGMPLDESDRRLAAHLKRLGYVDWFEAAGVRVYSATDKGREYFASLKD